MGFNYSPVEKFLGLNIMNYVLFQTALKNHSKNTGQITSLYFPDIMADISSALVITN
jgi:hypothetical protein